MDNVPRWRWAPGLLLLVGIGIAPAPAPAQSLGQVTAISAPILDVYYTPAAERADDTIPREKIALPLEVQDIASNKRLKVTLGRKAVWIDRGVVRTKGVQAEPTCETRAESPPTPSVLAPRGLGKGCK